MDLEILEPTLNQYQEYLQVERGLRKSTQTLYQKAIHYFFEFCVTHQNALFLPSSWGFADIHSRELEMFVREHIEHRHWKVNTVVTYVSAIRSLYHFLHLRGYVEANPLHHFTLKRELQEVVLSYLDEGSVQKVFQEPVAATLEGYRNRLLLEFFYGLGISGVQLGKIRNVQITSEPYQIQIDFGDKQKIHPIGKAPLAILKLFLEKRNFLVQQGMIPHSCFWVDETGESVSLQRIMRILRKYLRKIELTGESIRTLRELSYHHFADRGADVRSLKQLRDTKTLSGIERYKQEEFVKLMEKFQQAHIRNQPSDDQTS